MNGELRMRKLKSSSVFWVYIDVGKYGHIVNITERYLQSANMQFYSFNDELVCGERETRSAILMRPSSLESSEKITSCRYML